MNKSLAALVASSVFVILGLFVLTKVAGYNSSQEWTVLQSVNGELSVIDRGGFYWQGLGSTWVYPRTLETEYGDHQESGDAGFPVTFNDGGTAQLSVYVKVQLPTSNEQRLRMFHDFRDPSAVMTAVRAHLVNCAKVSGPVMSASENQASRKAEFNSIVEEQLVQGLFKMRRTEVELNEDSLAGPGEKKQKVQATEVVLDGNGKAIVIQKSPLVYYGLTVMQFSITGTQYDQQTLAQFAAKKESYLNAERSKAQRQEEVQSRLMIEEKGLRQIAEIEAVENQKKTKAIIEATMAAEVAEVAKKRAVTEASQRVEVAEQSRLEAEKLREIAAVQAETAELKKRATIAAAEARQKELELGGGISEETRILAEIKMKRDIGVAQYLATLASPATMITGGGEGGGGIEQNLMSMALMKYMGIIDMAPRVAARPATPITEMNVIRVTQ